MVSQNVGALIARTQSHQKSGQRRPRFSHCDSLKSHFSNVLRSSSSCGLEKLVGNTIPCGEGHNEMRPSWRDEKPNSESLP